MVDLKTLNAEHLSKRGWAELVDSLDEVRKARTDPRFFRQVERFLRHLRELTSVAVELNSNKAAAEAAYDHVKATKIFARRKSINRFEDIHEQTYDICLEALNQDLENMYRAFSERNLEALENQYRQIARWPVRFKPSGEAA